LEKKRRKMRSNGEEVPATLEQSIGILKMIMTLDVLAQEYAEAVDAPLTRLEPPGLLVLDDGQHMNGLQEYLHSPEVVGLVKSTKYAITQFGLTAAGAANMKFPKFIQSRIDKWDKRSSVVRNVRVHIPTPVSVLLWTVGGAWAISKYSDIKKGLADGDMQYGHTDMWKQIIRQGTKHPFALAADARNTNTIPDNPPYATIKPTDHALLALKALIPPNIPFKNDISAIVGPSWRTKIGLSSHSQSLSMQR
jgi:hypothetical protein